MATLIQRGWVGTRIILFVYSYYNAPFIWYSEFIDPEKNNELFTVSWYKDKCISEILMYYGVIVCRM